ncbi:MAG: hypothetical protein WBW81_05870 [Methylocella sp.]
MSITQPGVAIRDFDMSPAFERREHMKKLAETGKVNPRQARRFAEATGKLAKRHGT